MAFHDTRLPVKYGRGFQGGLKFDTEVVWSKGRRRMANIVIAQPEGRWQLAYNPKLPADFDELIAFFYARQGRAHSFRFKDWNDYKITDQLIGVGTGSSAQYQLKKTYLSGGYSFDITIKKPAASPTYVIKANGTPIGYSLNASTGVVTATATAGHSVTATGDYDHQVVFDRDHINFRFDSVKARSIPELGLEKVDE